MSFKDMKGFSEKHQKRVKTFLKYLQDYFDINYFNYYTVRPDGRWSFIASNLDHIDYYMGTQGYLVDTLLTHPDHFQNGTIYWSSLNSDCQDKLVDPIQAKFDMNHGVTLLHKPSDAQAGYEAFGFTAPSRNKKFHNIYSNEIDLFNKFCSFFKSENESILSEMRERSVNLLEVKRDAFFKKSPLQVQLSTQDRSDATSLFTKNLAIQKPEMKSLLGRLSRREKQCLNLYLQGKTAKLTGEILQLSNRTIEHYLETTKKKLGCSRKSDLFTLFKSEPNQG